MVYSLRNGGILFQGQSTWKAVRSRILGRVAFANGIFYKIDNIIDLQLLIDAGAVMFNCAGADE
jgi:hypothetical protein